MKAAGLEPEREFNALHGGSRQIWWTPDGATHVDVFLGEFRDVPPARPRAGVRRSRGRRCRRPTCCSRSSRWSSSTRKDVQDAAALLSTHELGRRRPARSRSPGCETCSPPTGASTRPRPTTSSASRRRSRRSRRASRRPSPPAAGRSASELERGAEEHARSACGRRSGAASAGTSCRRRRSALDPFWQAPVQCTGGLGAVTAWACAGKGCGRCANDYGNVTRITAQNPRCDVAVDIRRQRRRPPPENRTRVTLP